MSFSFDTEFTYQFIVTALPENCQRVLEIGCGTGELAARLTADGLDITAFDADAGAVASAIDKGVNAVQAEWPDYNNGKVDAILFTRSLHHIHDLAPSIGKAADCLKPGGRVIIEDFAIEQVDEKSISWFKQQLSLIEHNWLAHDCDDPMLLDLIKTDDPLSVWNAHHDHDLNTGQAMEAALKSCFASVEKAGAPYFFRYLYAESLIPEALRQQVYNNEVGSIAAGKINPLGLRFVASS